MHNSFPTYSLLIFFSVMISIGAVIAAFTDVIPATGSIILLSAVPLAAMIIFAAKVNQKILIPRLLIPQRYMAYIGWCFLIAMVIPLAGLAMEYAIRHLWVLHDRIKNYLSFWIPVDSLSTTVLLLMVFLGEGVRQLYLVWQKEAAEEEVVAKKCSEAIEFYNNRIKTQSILDSLRQIQILANTDADMANRQLRTLSATLRHELYDMPRLRVEDSGSQNSNLRLLEFFSLKSYGWLRHLCLLLLVACISITAIFDTPDHPDTSLNGLWAFLGMFLIISLVTYGNISLCRYFLYRRKIKTYLWGSVVFICVMTAAMVVVESISYIHTIHNGNLPLLYSILSTLSSFCTLTLYLCGITALTLLNYWLRTEHRTIVLKAETAKTELEFLQSQVNPHFLFNVLNNIGILIYEVPHLASEMLNRLSEMFEYQMKITNCTMVRLSDEVDFLRSYLLLEKSRKSPFLFSLNVADDIEGVEIPSLLLIPFVENATKHSTGDRNIRVDIYIDTGNVYFQCSNTADKTVRPRGDRGGLGIENTRRRLSLLYGSAYTLDVESTETNYKISLIIPFNYELHNSR